MEPEEPQRSPNGEKAETLEITEERDGDRLLPPSEVARRFGVGPRTVTEWAKAGKLGYRRTVGGQRRYPESEVRALLASLEVTAA